MTLFGNGRSFVPLQVPLQLGEEYRIMSSKSSALSAWFRVIWRLGQEGHLAETVKHGEFVSLSRQLYIHKSQH